MAPAPRSELRACGAGCWRARARLLATLLLVALMTDGDLVQPGPRRGARLRAAQLRRHAPDPHRRRHHRPRRGRARPLRARRGASRRGSVYGTEWRQAAAADRPSCGGWSAAIPEQLARVERASEALFETRGRELRRRPPLAAQAKRGSGGISLFYQAGASPTAAPELRAKLAQIAAAEREDLRAADGRDPASPAPAPTSSTEWLGWLAVLIGLGAIVLGLLAFRAISRAARGAARGGQRGEPRQPARGSGARAHQRAESRPMSSSRPSRPSARPPRRSFARSRRWRRSAS